MSRSYRKNLIYTHQQKHSAWTKFAKRQANKKVRSEEEIKDGNEYKKFYCQWNICDYRFPYDKDSKYAEPEYRIRSK